MDEQNRESLDKEIARLFEKMGTMEPGSQEYSRAWNDLESMSNLALKDTEHAREFMARSDRYTQDIEDREAKSRQERISNIMNAVKIAGEISVGFAALYLKARSLKDALDIDANGIRTAKTLSDVIRWIFSK